MFAPPDPYDPTLTADGLSEFFESQIPPESDPALDASSLGDFFAARETFDEDLGDLFETPRETPRPLLVLVPPREEPVDDSLEIEGVEFEAVQIEPVQIEAVQLACEEVIEYEEAPVPEPQVKPAPVFSAPEVRFQHAAPEVAVSSIQRAVMDFERFAEMFHAFARESQGLRVF